MADMDTHQDPTQSQSPTWEQIQLIQPEKKQRNTNPRLTKLSQRHGAIEGVSIFATWPTQTQKEDENKYACHGPAQGGIHGGTKTGVLSVLLSKSYVDDKDMGDTIFYTGTGGKDKPDGPQTSGQSWDFYQNQAFKISLESGKPVRVVRSHQCRSKYAPHSGLRYDGLYRVVDCRTDIGQDGKEICLSTLQRLPGQLPIPVRETNS